MSPEVSSISELQSSFTSNEITNLIHPLPEILDRERIINPFDHSYLELLRRILKEGTRKEDRTGVGTISLFGPQMEFDLSKGYPLLTTKKLHTTSINYELLWFLKGDTNVSYLQEHGVRIWNEWANEEGELGPVYGSQWRSWPDYEGGTIDQITDVINLIKSNPDSRRMVVSAWNVALINQMKLPPCHLLFQFSVSEGRLSCKLYQRSADMFLGVPFNIASYALFTQMVAKVTDLEPGTFIHTFGDAHIYLNHVQQVLTQLQRIPYPPPTLEITSQSKNIFDIDIDQIVLTGYQAHPHIKGEVAV